jgi:hypothetical protein
MIFLKIKESNYELALLEKQNPLMRDRLRALQYLRAYPFSGSDRIADIIGADPSDLEQWALLYRVGGIKLLLDIGVKSTLSSGHQLTYADLVNLVGPRELASANREALNSLLNYQSSGVPVALKVTISRQQNLQGQPLIYPNKKESDNKYYGFGRGVTYKILDGPGGREISARGFSLSENVVIESYKPDEAKPLVEGLKQRLGTVPPDKEGTFYDDIGPLFETRSEYQKFSRMANFEANYLQTFTVVGSRGRRYAVGTSKIKMTNYSVEVTYSPPRKPQ